MQAEKGAGNLLNDEKFINQLEKAFEEVSALEKKGYGNIDNIVKKYQKKFFVKPGSKTISGSTVQKGTDNVFTKTLATEIREYAKDLEIYNLESPSIEKALNDYRKIKNPKKGMIPNIAERYGINRATLDSYITNLNQRKYIPVKDPDEYTKAIRNAEKKALKKFSDRYFERVLSAPMTSGKYFADAADDEVVRLQKSHLGDKLTQDVRTSNIGYAAQEINQEVLKDVDDEMRQLNKKLANLYKNKPEGYLKEMDKLNQRGRDLAAATKGYKKFEAIDPYTGKKFVINFSSPSQELDPTELLGKDTKLADIDKQDKVLVKDLKKTAMQSATKTKTQVQADIKEIASNLEKLGCGKSAGGRILMSNGGPTKCALKGKKIIEEGLQNGFKKSDQALANTILKSGRFLKDAVSLRGLFGPAALAFTAAAEAGIVGYDMLSSGKSFREAVGDSVFNYMLGDKTKIDLVEERNKRMIEEGMTPEQMGKIGAMESAFEELSRFGSQFNKLAAIQKNRDAIDMSPEDTFNKGAFLLDLDRQENEARENIQDFNRTGGPQRLEKVDYAGGFKNLAEGLARNEFAQLQSVDNPLQSRRGDEKRAARMNELMLQYPDLAPGYDFMEGGIASLNVNKK